MSKVKIVVIVLVALALLYFLGRFVGPKFFSSSDNGEEKTTTFKTREEMMAERRYDPEVESKERAASYYRSALRDYSRANYQAALERLERAKRHAPYEFKNYRLAGQIYFEINKVRKAYEELLHASTLPNEDVTIMRDLTVLKRLIRYHRKEIDDLQREFHHNPNKRLAAMMLKEFREAME